MIKNYKTNILVFALLVLAFASSSSAEKIDVMLYYTPGGLYDRMHKEIVIPALGDKFGNYIVVDGCVEAVNYLESTDRSVIGMWGLGNQVPLENGSKNPCTISENNLAGIVSTLDFRLCSLKDNDELDLSYFLNNKVTVGAHAHPIWFMYMSELVAALNPSARVIPYRRSGEYLPALAAGEVDYLFANRVQEDSLCHLTTNHSNYNEMVAANQLTNNIWAESSIYTILASKNISDKTSFSLLQSIQNSEKYKEWASKKLIHLPPIAGKNITVEKEFINSRINEVVSGLK